MLIKTDVLLKMNKFLCSITLLVMLLLVVTEIKSYAQSQAQSNINRDNNVAVALLSQRADQIDKHLDDVDKIAENNRLRVNDIENEISQIRGFGIGIGALLSLFQVIQVVLQLRIKKNGI